MGNILVDGETHRGKLMAKQINWQDSKSNLSLITIRTMAPEVLKDKSTRNLPASDIWSLSSRFVERSYSRVPNRSVGMNKRVSR